jgi:hypothetical protein
MRRGRVREVAGRCAADRLEAEGARHRGRRPKSRSSFAH